MLHVCVCVCDRERERIIYVDISPSETLLTLPPLGRAALSDRVGKALEKRREVEKTMNRCGDQENLVVWNTVWVLSIYQMFVRVTIGL